MNNGYIKLWRKLQDNELWREPRIFSKAEAWIDILMEAQHSKETKHNVIGMRTITTNRGQSIKSLDTWAKRWMWNKSRVRRFFGMLKNRHMLVTENVSKTTRITVINYDAYHKKRNENETIPTRSCNDDETIPTPDKNVKNVKNTSSCQKKFPDGCIEIELSNLLFDRIKKNNSNYKKPNFQAWADSIDKMIRIDKRNPTEIKYVIYWCQQDDFWFKNILSTEKLRKQYDKLIIRMVAEGKDPTGIDNLDYQPSLEDLYAN